MGIREEMPLLARHEGDWAGTYTWVDQQGNVIDQHQSLLNCTFPADGEFDYFQVNSYTWPDGRTERNEFPAKYHDQKIWFDTERIDGHDLRLRVADVVHLAELVTGLPVGFLLDPLFDAIGGALLGAPGLTALWTKLANLPVVPYTNFNNSIVLGSLVFWVVAWLPIWFLARWAIARYRATLYERLRTTKFFKAVSASRLAQVYSWFQA